MSERQFNHKETDPELEALLAEMRYVPPRNPEKAEESKTRFLAEINRLGNDEQEFARKNNVNTVRQIKEYFKMATPKMKKVYQTAAITIVLIALLFGGAGITAAVATNSLPGDRLYAVKSSIENARIQLSGKPEDKVGLYLQYTQVRLEEIESLIAQGRKSDIAAAVRAYEQNIQKALAELERIRTNNAEYAQMLFIQIAASLESFALALQNVSINAGNLAPLFEDAIRFSKSAGYYSGELEFSGYVTEMTQDQWTVAGYTLIITSAAEIEDDISIGDFVEVEAWVDIEGKIYAKEIEQTSDDDMSFDDKFELKGIVSEVGEGYMIINGLRFELDSDSEIEDSIHIGDVVEVEAGMLGDGTFTIIEIDVEDDGVDDMDDDDDDGMNNDDDDDIYDDDDDDIYDDDDDDMYDDDDDDIYDDDDNDMYDDDDDDIYDDDDDGMNNDDDDDIYDDDDNDMYDDDDDDDMDEDDDDINDDDDDDMYDDDDDDDMYDDDDDDMYDNDDDDDD